MVPSFKTLGQLVTFQGHVNFMVIDLTWEGHRLTQDLKTGYHWIPVMTSSTLVFVSRL